MTLRLKMYPWQDWHEWVQAYHLLFSDLGIEPLNPTSVHGDKEIDLIKAKDENLKKAMGLISTWLLKNVGGD